MVVRTVPRSLADTAARRLLRLPDDARPIPRDAAERAFTTSLLVSATRCLLTYVVLPFVAPAVGFAAGVGPWIGVPLSGAAIAANIVTVRRLWLADHRWRWAYSGLAVGVIGLLVGLLIADVAELLR